MAISIFKGTVPAQDFSSFEQSINSAVNKSEGLRRQEIAKEEQEQKEAEAKYLSQAKLDPIYTASAFWRDQQGKRIQEYQNNLAKIYYRSKNRPTLQDQIEIQNNRQAFAGWQQKLNNDQQKYEAAVKELQKDPLGTKYDIEHFKNRVNEWTDPKGSGELSDDLLLPPLIPDLKTHFASKNYSLTKLKQITDKNGVRTTINTPMNEEEAKGKTIEDMYKDPSVYRTVTESFSALPRNEKEKYLSKYPPNESAKAITDYMYDNFGKYAFKAGDKTIGPAPKGRKGSSSSRIEGSVNFDNPSDKITIDIGKLHPDKSGKRNTQPQDVDVWGGYSLPGSITGVATARDYWDMETGAKESVDPGNDIIIKYPEIKYIPIGRNGEMAGSNTGYRDENGSLRPGYKIKAVLITRTEQGEARGLELTPELKNKLKTKNPKLADQIEEIPLEVKPKSGQKPEKTSAPKNVPLQKNQVLRMTKDGRKAIFDSTTKKFVKYAD